MKRSNQRSFGLKICGSWGGPAPSAMRSDVFLYDFEADECGDVSDPFAKIAEGGAAVHAILVRVDEPQNLLGVN
jgi:hypothetical protein